MNKQTVGYSESREIFNQQTGLKSWIKIWYDREIDEDQNPTPIFDDCKKLVQTWAHKDNNPQLTDDTWKHSASYPKGTPFPYDRSEPIIATSIPEQNLQSEKTLIAIDNATTLEDLEFYWDAAEKYGLVSQFNEKKKQLSQ